MEEKRTTEETKAPVLAGALDPRNLTQEKLFKRVRDNRAAYQRGQKAKVCGWYRLSPYVDDVSTEFFFAGFDNVPWQKAIRGEFN